MAINSIMRIAGTVILYHPDTTIFDNIETYLPLLQVLYIFDNTELKDETLHEKLSKLGKTIIFHDGENKGIARRLNTAANICLSNKYDWLLTMDQDSSFEKGIFEKYISCVQTTVMKEKVAMFGVNHETKVNVGNCYCTETTHLITSGSFLNIDLFKVIGGFDEALFIDEVDTDYCYNSILKGCKVIKFENISLCHTLGEISFHTSLKKLKKTSRTLHSPERLYFMVRNFLYINKKYPDNFFKEKKIRRIDLLNRIKNNFLYGDKKISTLKYIIKGWKDYQFTMSKI